MGILDIEAELETYFINNWSTTTIKIIDDKNFSYDGLTEWISLGFVPNQNKLIGFNGTTTGRQSQNGIIIVSCYHTVEKQVLALADTINEFLAGVRLPTDIWIDVGQPKQATNLDNGWWEVQVIFSVTQYS
jgi:hypothetical protein